jgi:hypothetical protein
MRKLGNKAALGPKAVVFSLISSGTLYGHDLLNAKLSEIMGFDIDVFGRQQKIRTTSLLFVQLRKAVLELPRGASRDYINGFAVDGNLCWVFVYELQIADGLIVGISYRRGHPLKRGIVPRLFLYNGLQVGSYQQFGYGSHLEWICCTTFLNTMRREVTVVI